MPENAIFLCHMFPNKNNPIFATFVAERAKAFSQFIQLDIIAPTSYVPFLRSNIPEYKEIFDGLCVKHPRYLGVPSFLWPLRWISYYLMCMHLWKGAHPRCDLVHIEWIYPDAYAFLKVAEKYHIKTVGVVHGNEAIGYFENKRHRKYYARALQKLDRIISVSSDLKQKMISEYGIPEHKIEVIHNGVDLAKFPMMKKEHARKILGLPVDCPIGVCVARYSPEKNLDVLIEAISLLGDDAPMILMIGEGPLRSRLEALRQYFKVEEKVTFIGPIDHDTIHQWYHAADFYCLPSQREGCPVVVHEALACGVPVVSTSVGAVPDLIENDDYGLLCPPSDAEALSRIIFEAMKKQWNREKIAAYGRRFTWESVAKQTIEVFNKVIC
ncbi:MAG: glycosyltransferase [Syntrophaceae bacterium]